MIVFYYLSFIAIVAGGALSAFTARKPARFNMWLASYLVLVAGVVQFGLVYCWHQLHIYATWECLAGLTLYNLANIAVMAGRAVKGRSRYALPLVYTGGGTLALAMILMIIGAWATPLTFAHICYLVFTLVIFISMPIGLMLSARRN